MESAATDRSFKPTSDTSTTSVGLDGAYQPVTKTITLTSTGASLDFAITPPTIQNQQGKKPFTVLQTRGTTPATIHVTLEPSQVTSYGAVTALEIVAPGSSEPALFVPIRLLAGTAQLRAVQASSLVPDSTGNASTTLSITASSPLPGTLIR